MAQDKKKASSQQLAARAAAQLILDSPEYRASFLRRMIAGTLPPQLEVMLWHYRYGKPTEQLQVNVGDLGELTNDDLESRARYLLEQLRPETPSNTRFNEAEDQNSGSTNVFDLITTTRTTIQ